MGVESIQIILHNKSVFYSGESVTGFCQVSCSAPTELSSLSVRFEGHCRVHWSETRSRTRHSGGRSHTEHYTVHYNSGLQLVRLEQNVMVQGGFLQPGLHNLPFGFQIPHNLVTSFEAVHGYIRYFIEAKVPQGWFRSLFAPKGRVSVKIIQQIDTNISQYQFPVRGTDSKELCCCCCAQGPITIEAHTDRAAYCPHESTCITAAFHNKSDRNVRPYARLVQRVLYHAQGHSRRSSNSWTLAPSVTDNVMDNINGNGSAQWNGINFTLPGCSPSITLPIMQVSYYIEVGLDIPMAFDLVVYLPIVIGTIPHTGQSSAITQQIDSNMSLPLVSPGALNPPPAYSTTTPWTGTGHSQGGPPPSAPPLEYGIRSGAITDPPPSYFEAVLNSQVAELPDEDNNDDNQATAPPIGFEQKGGNI